MDRGVALRIEPLAAPGSGLATVDLAREVERFLELAVPALVEYQRQKDDPHAVALTPVPPESLAENQFWSDFLDERDKILRLKWIDSKNAGHDIRFREPIRRWLEHRPKWRAAHAAAG